MNQLPLVVPLAFFLTTAFLATACSTDDTPPAASSEEPGPQDAPLPTTPSPGASPGGRAGTDFEPLTSRSSSPADGTIVAPGAVFTLPPGWIAETPKSGMRLAQALIPGAAGEGQLTVFYFGPGGGGGIESNIQRWVGQMERDPASAPLRDTFEVNGFRITWVDVAGTLKPSTMGTGPTTPQPGSRLLAGIVEGDQGPWFFKATGPAETLQAQRDAFLSMLRSATSHG